VIAHGRSPQLSIKNRCGTPGERSQSRDETGRGNILGGPITNSAEFDRVKLFERFWRGSFLENTDHVTLSFTDGIGSCVNVFSTPTPF
jgi:hypothetical protein